MDHFRLRKSDFEEFEREIKQLFPSMNSVNIFRAYEITVGTKNTIGLGGQIYNHYKLLQKRLTEAGFIQRTTEDDIDAPNFEQDKENVPG